MKSAHLVRSSFRICGSPTTTTFLVINQFDNIEISFKFKRVTMEKPMVDFNKKEVIVSHYETVSPYYRSLWGEHLHHGYWQ